MPAWLLSVVLFIGLTVYIASFWGSAARWLPAPFSGWSHKWVHLLAPWWQTNMLPDLPEKQRYWLLYRSTDLVLGLLVPATVLLAYRRKLSDVGLGAPNVLGLRLIAVSVLLSIPFGFWLLGTTAPVGAWPAIDWVYALALLAMIPEHFLICGTCTAILLPERRLPFPVPLAEAPPRQAGGDRRLRFLRWLGLAQPHVAGRFRWLSWLGLTGPQALAILASGALFGMVHVGKAPLELALSFPGGIAVAYLTVRAHSIWPALVAHWSMNLIPLGIAAMFR
ncbi:MAG: CPBP family intramembrane metalloprotease [Phycisphaerae bacterium]|nr:CPBP family intramembrane metalloprotease [Phycisphaerae bacterium]